MTHFSIDPKRVRIDIFKADGGKWQETVEVVWHPAPATSWEKPAPIYREFEETVRRKLGVRYEGSTIVCLEPCHPHAHPLMWQNYKYERPA